MKTSLPFFFDTHHCSDILAKNGYLYVILGSLCFSTRQERYRPLLQRELIR